MQCSKFLGRILNQGLAGYETDYFTVMFGARKCRPITTYYLRTLNDLYVLESR